MKIVLNMFKVCDTEEDRFIILRLSEAEGLYNLYEQRIFNLKAELDTNNQTSYASKVREINNLNSACEQVIGHLEALKVPYTIMDAKGHKTLTIHKEQIRIRQS